MMGPSSSAAASVSDPSAKSGALLYITDGSTKAYILSYPALKTVGTISGFLQPIGACSDTKGNVWIADYGAQQIDEFKHGETKAVVKLTLPNSESPQQCAIDKKGNLAVSASGAGSSGPGYVLIYKGGKGKPQVITDSTFLDAMFVAYDAKGDLFLDGTAANNAFEYAELLPGKKTFTPVALKQQIGYPSGLQFDGRNIALGDQQSSVIYRTKGAKVTGKVTLGGGSHALFGYVVDGSTLIALDNGGTQAVETYKYPAGGAPLKTVELTNPSGIALSR
jgi:hypothetical protein